MSCQSFIVTRYATDLFIDLSFSGSKVRAAAQMVMGVELQTVQGFVFPYKGTVQLALLNISCFLCLAVDVYVCFSCLCKWSYLQHSWHMFYSFALRAECFVCVRSPSPCAWSQEGTGTAFGPATVRIPGSQTASAGAHEENKLQTVSR